METRSGTATMDRPTGQASESFLGMLNELRARELAVGIQYMRHHYRVTGSDSFGPEDEFKKTAITEMKHAEALGERIDFLGGDPTTKPWDIPTGEETLQQMATVDLRTEEEGIAKYREAIRQAEQEGDTTTRRMLEDILADEEEHVKVFRQMLGK
jgi:bacterioferritin